MPVTSADILYTRLARAVCAVFHHNWNTPRVVSRTEQWAKCQRCGRIMGRVQSPAAAEADERQRRGVPTRNRGFVDHYINGQFIARFRQDDTQ